MADRKLDIFKVLSNIDNKDINFIATLSEEELSGFQPLVAMMWMCSTNNKQQQFMVNEGVNKYIFALSAHKGLLYKLMVASSASNTCRYNWKKRTSNPTISSIATDVVKTHYGCSSKDAAEYLTVLDNSTILSWADSYGLQRDEITKLKRQLK